MNIGLFFCHEVSNSKMRNRYSLAWACRVS